MEAKIKIHSIIIECMEKSVIILCYQNIISDSFKKFFILSESENFLIKNLFY